MTGQTHHIAQPASLEDAFVAMVTKYDGVLRKIAGSFHEREEDRQELMQEIVYRLWSAYPEFRRESSEFTWLHAIAKNTAIKQRRAQRGWIEYTDNVSENDHPTAEEEQKEIDNLITIESMHDSDREITLLLVEGYDYPAISGILGIAPATLRNRVQRLKKRLERKQA